MMRIALALEGVSIAGALYAVFSGRVYWVAAFAVVFCFGLFLSRGERR